MSSFRVWAPLAHTVALRLGEADVPMLRGDGGWWSVQHEAAAQTGTEYSYIVDGGEPRPDPRSGWQPYGVHGRSRVVDHSTFEWTDARWQAPPLSSAVIYELHVGTFTPEGTFDSLRTKLDYLVQLGVTHVELMPVNEFSGRWGWGYDGVDLYAPHHAYGDPEALKRLVNDCHAMGLRCCWTWSITIWAHPEII